MELDSGADSVSSTPRSAHLNHHQKAEDKAMVRLMCSFGGKILPRPHDNQLRYVGGDTRIVAVHRSISYSSLISKLARLLPPNSGEFTVKYQLPHEDLDALITVSTDEDVDNMMDEFDRLHQNTHHKIPRLRLFLFPNNLPEDSRTSSITSLLDGSRKRESWFLDALNGDSSGGLERGRSEASSIVSEVPDYLFGFDNSDEPSKFKNRFGLGDGVAGADPGSPAVPASVSSPFGSTSSAPAMPNLPPVRTKPENPVEELNEPLVQPTVGYTGAPVWNHNPTPSSPYPGPPMQAIPVYYVPAGGPGGGPNAVPHAHMQPVPVTVPVPGHYVQQYGPVSAPGQVQVPVGFSGSGPMYGGGPVVRPMGAVDPYEIQMQGNMVTRPGSGGQPVYYGLKNAGHGMAAPYPGMVAPIGAEDGAGSGPDAYKGRTFQG